MRRTVRDGLVVLTCLMLICITGCFAGDPRTSNQGGGNLISAGSKVAGGDISALTPDEWQILCDNAPTFAPQFAAQYGVDVSTIVWPVLTDEQAQAITDFLVANNITSIAELQRRIQAGDLQVPDALVQLFESTVQAQST